MPGPAGSPRTPTPSGSPARSEIEPAAIRRRIKRTLLATQSFGSAGFLVASTVTPIVGAALTGRASWAGVPATFYWGGGAVFALLWGRLMDPLGRRLTLTLGLISGIIGAAIAASAIGAGSFAGFVAGLVLMGGANTSIQLARFVAAEVHPAAERGRAISMVVMGGTVGGVLGPLLVAPTSRLAESFGRPGLAGPYAASAGFFLVGAIIVMTLLRPEPRDVARALGGSTTPAASDAQGPRTVRAILADRWVVVAVFSMLLSQGVMSMLMVISSLHMRNHQHPLSAISLVMSSHMVGMYGFSLVTGKLADSWGRGPLIAVGAGLLVVAGLGAIWAVAAVPMTGVLFLLGLGWNLCYVGGSTLLSDRLTQVERARVQGINDALLTSASAVGSLMSGIVFSRVGYPAMGMVAAAVALIPLALGWSLPRGSGHTAIQTAP